MIYTFFADGFEEVEALTPVDYIRRAGVSVSTVGVGNKTVNGAHSIPVVCDCVIEDISDFENIDGIILPGGMPGTLNLENNEKVQEIIDFCAKNGKMIAAICAAPSILGHKGLLDNKNAVCFPGFEEDLHGAVISDLFAVRDGNIITAKGAGAASEFSFEIISFLKGNDESDKIRKTVQTCY